MFRLQRHQLRQLRSLIIFSTYGDGGDMNPRWIGILLIVAGIVMLIFSFGRLKHR